MKSTVVLVSVLLVASGRAQQQVKAIADECQVKDPSDQQLVHDFAGDGFLVNYIGDQFSCDKHTIHIVPENKTVIYDVHGLKVSVLYITGPDKVGYEKKRPVVDREF